MSDVAREHAPDAARDVQPAPAPAPISGPGPQTPSVGLAAAQAAQLATRSSAAAPPLARERARAGAQAAQLSGPAQALELGRAGTAVPLPHRAVLEQRFGRSLGALEVFVSPTAAARVAAEAFAVGHTIVLAEADPGLEIVAEEVAHTLQQGGDRGAVPAPADLAMTSPGDAVEVEARAAAAEVAAATSVQVPAAATGESGMARVELARSGEGEQDEGLEIFRERVGEAIPAASLETVYGLFKDRLGDDPASWTIYEHIASWSDFATLAEDVHATAVALYLTAVDWADPVFDPSTFATFASGMGALADLGWMASQKLTLFRALHRAVPAPTDGVAAVVAEVGDAAFWTEATSRWSLQQSANVFWPFLHFVANGAGVVPGEPRAFFWAMTDVLENPSSENVQAFTREHFEAQLATWSQDKVIALWSGRGEAISLAEAYAAGKTKLVEKGDEDQPAPVEETEENAVEVLNTMPLAALFDPDPERGATGDELTLFRVASPAFGKLAWPFWQQLSRSLVQNAELDVHAFLVTGLRHSSVFGSIELPNLLVQRGQGEDGVIDGLTYHLHSEKAREQIRQTEQGDLPADLEHPLPADSEVETMGDAITWTAQYWNYIGATHLNPGELEQAEEFGDAVNQRDQLQNHVLREYLRLQANPVFEHALEGETSVGAALGFEHPGVEFGAVSVTLDENGRMTAPGTIAMDVGEEGFFATGVVERTVVPNPEVDTTLVQGRIDNDILPEQVNSGLDAIFGPDKVSVSAHLVDSGVEATVVLEALPPDLLPGFTLSAPSATIFINESGAVAAFNVGVIHDESRASAALTASYSATAGWAVEGQLTVPELALGAVAGATVGPLTLDIAAAQDGNFSLAAVDGEVVSLATSLWGVEVTGSVSELSLRNEPGRGLLCGGVAAITADLPVVGPIGTTVRVVDNQLQTLTVTAAARPFAMPADSPWLSGTVGGSLSYDFVAQQPGGSLAGTASVSVPGLETPVGVSFALSADATGIQLSGGLETAVPLGPYLTLDSLALSYADGALELTGAASVTGIMGASANVAVRIDGDGLHIVDAGLTIPFGNETFGGSLSFSYSSEEGVGFAGNASIQVAPDKRLNFSLVYPSPGEAEAASSGRFDAHVDNQEGWALWDGIPMEHRELIGDGGVGVSLPIFSVGILVATLEIDVAARAGVSVDPLVVAGSVDIEGVDLSTLDFERIHVEGAATSGLRGELVFEPSVGLGVSVISEFIAKVTGGLAMPVTARAGLGIGGQVSLDYVPGQGLSAEQAMVSAPLSFSVDASPRLFLELEAFGGLVHPEPWQTESLGEFEILPETNLLTVNFDLNTGELTFDTHTPEAPGSAELSLPEGTTPSPHAPSHEQGSEQPVAAEPVGEASASSGETSAGGFSFDAILSALEGAMPEPIVSIKQTIDSIGAAVAPIIDRVERFFDWLNEQAQAVFGSGDELLTFLEHVAGEFATLNPANPIEVVETVLSLIGDVMRRLMQPLIEGDAPQIYITRMRKDRGLFNIDELDSDEYAYQINIPGLLETGPRQGDDPFLSAAVIFLHETLGVPVRDIDELEPPHFIAFMEHDGGEGAPLGSCDDSPKVLRNGHGLGNDAISSIKVWGVTPGTYLHLYEHDGVSDGVFDGSDRGRRAVISIGVQPEQEDHVDEEGLEHRQPNSAVVRHLHSSHSGEGYSVSMNVDMNDKASRAEVRLDPGETLSETDAEGELTGPGHVYLLDGSGQAFWGIEADRDSESNLWTDDVDGGDRDYYNDTARGALLVGVRAGSRIHFHASGRDVGDGESLVLEAVEDIVEPLTIMFDSCRAVGTELGGVRVVAVGSGGEGLDGNVSQVWIEAPEPTASSASS